MVKNIVYKAIVSSPGMSDKYYYGASATTFKLRYGDHQSTITNTKASPSYQSIFGTSKAKTNNFILRGPYIKKQTHAKKAQSIAIFASRKNLLSRNRIPGFA